MMRIEQESTLALELQRRVLRGDAAPAAFQRPYVWTEKEVEALWASILMGLPIGAFLLWRPESGARAARMLGPVELEPSHHAALVLDGQNRLASLAWSATDPEAEVPEDSSGKALWRNGRHLVADTHERRVVFVDAEVARADRWLVPVHVIGHGLQMALRDIWDGDKDDLHRVDWLDALENRLRQSRVIVTTIQANEQDARRAYMLMASAGVPMSAQDFDAALAGSRTEDAHE